MTVPLVKTSVRHELLRTYGNLPDHPMKLRLYDWCKSSHFFRHARVEFAYGKFNLDLVDFVQHEMFLHGCYEPATLALFETLVRPGDRVVDVGANVGQYAIAAARLSGSGGRVVAVEPNPQIGSRLIDNVRMNNLEDRIAIVTSPMSDCAAMLAFGLPGPWALGTTRLKRPGETGGFVVLASTIADLITQLNLDRIDVLKIDVEGHDMKVIDGALTHSSVRPKHIVFEYLHESFDYGIEAHNIPGHFSKHGYELSTIDGAPFSAGRELPEGNLWARRL